MTADVYACRECAEPLGGHHREWCPLRRASARVMQIQAWYPGYRVPPPTYRGWLPRDLDMTDDSGVLCTLPADQFTRGQARAWFAREWGEDFRAVRVARRRLIWDPLTAAEEWREARCDDGWPDGGCVTPSGLHVHPTNCLCPWPTIMDFWGEDGVYCPWRPAGRGEACDAVVWSAEYAAAPRAVKA